MVVLDPRPAQKQKQVDDAMKVLETFWSTTHDLTKEVRHAMIIMVDEVKDLRIKVAEIS